MKYRVLKPLTTGHRPGDVVEGDAFKERFIQPLLDANAISPVAFPPAEVLWDDTRLSVEEIIDVEPQELAEILGITEVEAKQRQQEAAEAMGMKEVDSEQSDDKG